VKHRYLILLAVLAVIFLASPVLAAYNPNFTQIIPTNGTIVTHVNQTYMIYDQDAVTLWDFYFYIIVGLILFILSCILSCWPDRFNEIDAMFSGISSFALFIASFRSQAVDVVTSYGATSVLNGSQINVYLMENHTLYHFDYSGVFLWVLSTIALINTIRILITHKRFEQMMVQQQGGMK
jgi:hypothetical protein